MPAALYNTESGFENAASGGNPTPNPPVSAGSGVAPVSEIFANGQGIALAGSASQGTRFAIQFSTPPVGSNPSVPLTVPLTSSGVSTGVLVLVCGTDANGAGGTPGSCTATGIGGTSLITSANNNVAIYEVAFANPSALETASIVVSVNPTINLNLNPPVGGSPQVNLAETAQATFAPFYPATATGFALVGMAQPMTAQLSSAGAPIPRFIQNFQPTPPITLFQYSKCACDLLFPWVVADANFTTAIIVANTSLDPCGGVTCGSGFTAKPQAGNVTFWFFGTTDITEDATNGGANTPPGPTPANVIGCQTTAAAPAPCALTTTTTGRPVPAGSYVAFIISPNTAIAGAQNSKNNLGPLVDGATGKVATNFAGYVIAQSEFQYCHGIANILSGSNLSDTYLGLVLDNGSQLGRTNQTFSDRLEN